MEADLWLSFGSFLYGFETEVVGLSLDSIQLSLASDPLGVPSKRDSGATNSDSDELFALIQSRARSVVCSEVRIFLEPQLARAHSLSETTIHMTSPLVPELCHEAKCADHPCVRLRGLAALRPLDDLLWRQLVTRIWPLQKE